MEILFEIKLGVLKLQRGREKWWWMMVVVGGGGGGGGVGGIDGGGGGGPSFMNVNNLLCIFSESFFV